MNASTPSFHDRNPAGSAPGLRSRPADTTQKPDRQQLRRDPVNARIDSKPASTTQVVLDRHLGAFAAGDLELLLSDYTNESILFTPNGPLVGPGPIRGFMTGLFAEFAKPGASFDLHTMNVAADVGYIVWSATTADNVYELATDTFVVRDGKIAFQSFAGKIVPRSSANGTGSTR
jgi:hypothetical protein